MLVVSLNPQSSGSRRPISGLLVVGRLRALFADPVEVLNAVAFHGERLSCEFPVP